MSAGTILGICKAWIEKSKRDAVPKQTVKECVDEYMATSSGYLRIETTEDGRVKAIY